MPGTIECVPRQLPLGERRSETVEASLTFAKMSRGIRLAKIVLASRNLNIVIIKTVDGAHIFRPPTKPNMMIKFATCLLALSLFSACQSTQSTASRQTMSQRIASNTNAGTSLDEPPPPAEGPEDIPAEGPRDPNRNPGLLPTPLLRSNAAAGL